MIKMAHTIQYNGETDGVDDTTTTDIINAVVTWASGDADRHFDGIAYDRVNDTLRISVRVTDVSDINAMLSDLDSGISNINTTHGTSLPMASDTANIVPE